MKIELFDYLRTSPLFYLNGTDQNFRYDANGNMDIGYNFDLQSARTLSYNGDNMPTQISQGLNDTQFLYDGEGVRAKKTDSNGSTYYIGEHFEVHDDGDDTITETNYIFGGNLRVAMIEGGNDYYFHKDHLGSSTVITDGTGEEINVSQRSEYLPFGLDRSNSGGDVSDYKFTDQELDSSTNLYNYDARLYDPVIGVFITPDPLFSPNLATHIQYITTIEADDFGAYFSNPLRLNRYSYCLNNPLIYTDPLGLAEYLVTYGTVSASKKNLGGVHIFGTVIALSQNKNKMHSAVNFTGKFIGADIGLRFGSTYSRNQIFKDKYDVPDVTRIAGYSSFTSLTSSVFGEKGISMGMYTFGELYYASGTFTDIEGYGIGLTSVQGSIGLNGEAYELGSDVVNEHLGLTNISNYSGSGNRDNFGQSDFGQSSSFGYMTFDSSSESGSFGIGFTW